MLGEAPIVAILTGLDACAIGIKNINSRRLRMVNFEWFFMRLVFIVNLFCPIYKSSFSN
jgi:hypothetical protein